jgi:hypothetical protein
MNHTEHSRALLTFAVYKGDQLVSREAVAEDVVKIGQDPRSHLRVNDPLASRMHAVLEVLSPTDITLIDLGCDAGSFVNGQRVNKCRLRAGDKIRIGETTLELESARQESSPVLPFGALVPAMPVPRNPFLPQPIASPKDAAELFVGESGTYVMVKSASLSPGEAEDPTIDAVEVKVLWGCNTVHIAHLTRSGTFVIGDGGEGCDFTVPEGLLDAPRAPLVKASTEGVKLVIPPRAEVTLAGPGEARVSLSELVTAGRATQSTELAGGYELVLPPGARARIEPWRSQIAFEVAEVRAGKGVPVGFFASMDATSHGYTGLSAFMHLAMIASLAFFLPGMAADNGETINREQIDAMKPYLNAMAEKEQQRQDEAAAAGAKDREGGTGAQAKDEEGAMGTQLAPHRDARFGVRGPADNLDPHIARQRSTVEEAATFGMVPILMGDAHAPIAAWAREDASGKDPKSALGNMWGSSIDDAFGMGGLGLTGVGEGGGGRFEGIGMGDIGTLGHGRGVGTGQRFGNGDGSGIGSCGGAHCLPGGRTSVGPRLRPEPTTVVGGKLPAEVIQRIVRQNFGRFRLCYENGLRNNPGLTGRVAVRFVIDRNGSVSVSAADKSSDMPDQAVIQCVVRGFQNLSFPSPEGGMVSVVYPLMFSPGE